MKKLTNKILLISAAGLFVATAISAQPPRRYQEENQRTRFELLDKNSDKKIDKKEWEIHFSEIDTDKDGSLSEAEMSAHHQNMMDKMDENRPARGRMGR